MYRPALSTRRIAPRPGLGYTASFNIATKTASDPGFYIGQGIAVPGAVPVLLAPPPSAPAPTLPAQLPGPVNPSVVPNTFQPMTTNNQPATIPAPGPNPTGDTGGVINADDDDAPVMAQLKALSPGAKFALGIAASWLVSRMMKGRR